MYIYSPCEPQAVPAQGSLDYNQPPVYDPAKWDSPIGICGNCRQCPRVWKMEVPLGYGDPSYSGTFYFRRAFEPLSLGFLGWVFANCKWDTEFAWGAGCPITGANRSFVEDPAYYWNYVMGFSSDGPQPEWYIQTPIFRGPSNSNFQSVYRFNQTLNRWNCLGANTFDYFDTIGSHPWFYVPPTLTITPYYA